MGTFAPWHLILMCVMFLLWLLPIIPFAVIFSKAGFSPVLCILMPFPVVNTVLLFCIAFVDWPALKKDANQ
jgi:hypothetical protein